MKPILKLIAIAFLVFSLVCVHFVQAVVIESVHASPDQIAPGETSKIKLGIGNNGDVDIEDVSIFLDLSQVPFAPYDSSSEFNLNEIKEDRIKYAEFEIIALADAGSGIYKIPVKIDYKEDEEEKTKEFLIGLSINSDPVIGISLEDGLLIKSQKNEISVEIVNKGLSDVKFLEIEVGSSTSYSVLSQKKVYVGDLDSDDFESVDFDIYFNSNSPNAVNLPLSIFYKDALNNEYTKSFTLPLTVYTNEKAIELGLLERNNKLSYIGILVIVVLLYIGYRRYKRYKKNKKSEEKENKKEF